MIIFSDIEGISPVSYLNGFVEEEIIEGTIFNEDNLIYQSQNHKTVGFSLHSSFTTDNLDLEYVFNHLEGKIIISGGPGVRYADIHKYSDYIVIGPGEYFINKYLKGSILPSVYTENKKSPSKFELTNKAKENIREGKCKVSVETLKQCYWDRCYFCDYSSYSICSDPRLDYNSSKFITETMNDVSKKIKEIGGIPEIHCSHPSIDKENLKFLCRSMELYKDNEYSWGISLRPEKQFVDLLPKISELNGELSLGVEFLSNRDIVNKGIDPLDIMNFITECGNNNVEVWGNFLYFVPLTTKSDMLRNVENINRIKKNISTFQMNCVNLTGNCEYGRNPEKYGFRLAEGGCSFINEKKYEHWFQDNIEMVEELSHVLKKEPINIWQPFIHKL